MNDPRDNWEKMEIEETVYIPTLDGKDIAETVKVKVQGYRNPDDGEIYLDGHALAELDKVKARHMGLLAPEQIKELRENLGLSQKHISTLLQIGEKTWTRWESGRERPSRSMNVLLNSLSDGRIDTTYLQTLVPDFVVKDIQVATETREEPYIMAGFSPAAIAANEEFSLAA